MSDIIIPWVTSADISQEELDKRQTTFTTQIMYYFSYGVLPPDVRRKNPACYPTVCIINGAGESGKDTFIEMCAKHTRHYVRNISTIDPVKDFTFSMATRSKHASPVKTGNYIDTEFDPATEGKTMAFRSFLSAVKAAWEKYDNGPTLIVLEKICSTINVAKTMHDWPHVIFVHCREMASIRLLQEWIWEYLHLINFTLLIDGRSDPESFDNDSDRLVRNYKYDVTIKNDKGLEELDAKAETFIQTVERINTLFGIPATSTKR